MAGQVMMPIEVIVGLTCVFGLGLLIWLVIGAVGLRRGWFHG